MSGIIGGAGSKSGIIGETELEYETGIWHPESTINTSTDTGTYIKIGSLVIACGNFTFSASSSGSSGSFTGLPFTSKSNTHGSGIFGGGVISTGIDYEGSDHIVDVAPYVNNSNTNWTFYHMGNNGGWSNNIGLGSGDSMIFQIIYFTDF